MSILRKPLHALTSTAIVLVGSLLPSCGITGTFPSPKEVPGLLTAVGDDWDPYALRLVEDPLDDVPAGTVMDDLAGIDGCWASVERFGAVSRDGLSGIQRLFYDVVVGMIGANATGDLLDVYHFDLNANTYTSYTWTGGSLGLGPIYGFRGDVIDMTTDRITMVTMEIYDSHDQEGRLVENPEFQPLEGEPFEIEVTLSGDLLKVDLFPETVDPNGEDVSSYKRFPCPEE
jgi:hypothetical protein